MQTQGSDMNIDSYVDASQDTTKVQRVIRLKKRNNKSMTQHKSLNSSQNQSQILDNNTVNNVYGNALSPQPQSSVIEQLSKSNMLYSKATIRDREKYLANKGRKRNKYMDLTPDVCENVTAARNQAMKLDIKRAGSTTTGQLILNREKSLILSPSQQKKERAAIPKQ